MTIPYLEKRNEENTSDVSSRTHSSMPSLIEEEDIANLNDVSAMNNDRLYPCDCSGIFENHYIPPDTNYYICSCGEATYIETHLPEVCIHCNKWLSDQSILVNILTTKDIYNYQQMWTGAIEENKIDTNGYAK